jgi:parallel beta-helix repeat protein
MKRLILAAAWLVWGTNLCARTLHVQAEYGSIQAAIIDANNGDVVVVSAGTYQENINFLGKAITVRSTDPNDPNAVADTVIDGSNPADANFSSVVTFNSGEDNNSVLAGFTITGGTGSWLLVSWEFRGLRWNRCGGGVVCYNMSAPTITKNVFVNNRAGQGGGVYVYGDPVNPNDPSNPPVHVCPVICENVFTNNSAIVDHGFTPPDNNYVNNDHGDGGAIVAFQGCDATIVDNLIENNHADYYGGGLHLRQWSNGLIEDNRILHNDSSLGAGIHVTYSSSPTVRANAIRRNMAGPLGGGGVYVYNLSDPLIELNTITQNSSTYGAGIAVHCSSTSTIRSNLVYKNDYGAGIQIWGSFPKISHNTILQNGRDGIECRGSSGPTIENNIICSHRAGWGIHVEGSTSPEIRYNNIWNNELGTCGPSAPDQTGINGNISADPKFVSPDGNDYHLGYNSPCINAGDPNFNTGDIMDYDAEARWMGQFVDMGADEAWPIWNTTTGSQHGTIQHAVDEANEFDVIVVTVGAHTGDGNRDIDFHGKAVTVTGIDPNDRTIVSCTIIDSQGSDVNLHRGFHFRNQEGPDSVVSGLTITGGGGVYEGGAIRCYNNSNPTIKNCLITDNAGGGRAGGIHCESSSPTIVGCIITDNVATRGYGAGVSCFFQSNPTIVDCIITGNTAVGSGHHGGGIYCHDHSDAFVANCIIAGNTADHRGGGLSAYWSSPTFLNCTVVGNRALEGGGISSFRESDPQVINCIVRDNIAPDGNQLALINTSRVWGGANIPTEMTVLFSDIEGDQGAATVDHDCTLHWGPGNIDHDPCFVDAGYWDDANTPHDANDDFFVTGNHHLLPASACINVGDNNSVPIFLDKDIDQEARLFEGRVDMGADEVTTNPFDLNGDGIVDYLELDALAGEWLLSGGELQSDFYYDGFIDFADLSLLAGQWLWTAGWYE